MAREPKVGSAKEADTVTAICGVIRPIAGFGDYTAKHWSDIAAIIDEAVAEAGMEARLVSDDVASSIIHAKILKNLYSNEIVIADVSGKNPNVMLELGLRLAFDKPVIVVKDDETDYSFDTSPIEHVGYPRTLHYSSIIEFKDQLAKKIVAIRENGAQEASFLKQFGPIKVAQIDEEKVPAYEVISDEIRELKSLVRGLIAERNNMVHISPTLNALAAYSPQNLTYSLADLTDDDVSRIVKDSISLSGIDRLRVSKGEDRWIFDVKPDSLGNWNKSEAILEFRKYMARNFPRARLL